MSVDWLEDNNSPLSAAEIEAIRKGESSMPDVEAAEALTDSVSGLMVSVATGGPAIKSVNNDYKREHRALAAVLQRLDIEYPNRFSDLWRWYGKWSDGSLPTYASRRAFIAELFEPVHGALAQQADAARELAEGAEGGPTGWPGVDQKLGRLRRLFREAEDADGHNAVGLQCMSILTVLGQVVFDPARDLPPGEAEPGLDDAKARIGYFVRRVAKGNRFENVRKLVNAAYGQANAAKHRRTATRLDAGIAANAATLLVSMLRLMADEDEPPAARRRPPTGDIPF